MRINLAAGSGQTIIELNCLPKDVCRATGLVYAAMAEVSDEFTDATGRICVPGVCLKRSPNGLTLFLDGSKSAGELTPTVAELASKLAQKNWASCPNRQLAS